MANISETTNGAPEDARLAGGIWPVALTAVVVVLALTGALYWQTLMSMVEIWWRSETFAHGFLIMPISAYMIWARWDTIRQAAPGPTYWALPLLALASAGWFLFSTADVVVLTQLSFVVMLQLAVIAVLGWRTAWAMAFPLAYLWFAVPMGEGLQYPLMDFTADFTVWAVELTGVPVYREARYLTLPTGNWEVAEACSGIRYLIASVALGCLYAYLTYRALWRRLLFIGLAIVVPILANGVRAFSIVMVGHFSGMKLATGIDHIIWGWVFFGIVMFLLFLAGSLWRERDEAPPPQPVPGGGGVAAPRATGGSFLVAAVATLAVAGLGQVLAGGVAALQGDAGDYSLALPAAAGGWQGPLETEDRWQPRFAGASDELRARYSGPVGEVEVRAVHYREEGQGAELVNSENRVWDREFWRRLGERERQVQAGAEELTVHEAVLGLGDSRRVVWYWYQIAGSQLADPVTAKLYGAVAKVTGMDPGGTLMAVAADAPREADEARRRLAAFLAANPSLVQDGVRAEGDR